MNTEFKGTKGKWSIQGPKIGLGDQTYFPISTDSIVKEGDAFPGFYYPHSYQTAEEMKANALLISKAPEMLSMLQKCSDILSSNNIAKEIDRLINQATTL